MAFFKALIPAGLLTWIIATIMGSNGSKGGFLYIHNLYLTGGGVFSGGGTAFYWSWPLFVASLLLAFALFKMLD